MTVAHDDYKRLDLPLDVEVARCPVCNGFGELWQFSESVGAPTTKTICCETAESFGPQSGEMNSGCLLYMPPNGFYQATIREAIAYWNAYAEALTELRKANLRVPG